jgi:preprotein translocase SecE subunit
MVTTSMSNSGSSPDDPKDSKAPVTGGKARGSLPVPKSKRGLKGFYNEVVREMKKVTWPTRAETNRLTTVVLAVCLLLVTLLSALGFVFGFVIDILTGVRHA